MIFFSRSASNPLSVTYQIRQIIKSKIKNAQKFIREQISFVYHNLQYCRLTVDPTKVTSRSRGNFKYPWKTDMSDKPGQSLAIRVSNSERKKVKWQLTDYPTNYWTNWNRFFQTKNLRWRLEISSRPTTFSKTGLFFGIFVDAFILLFTNKFLKNTPSSKLTEQVFLINN